jgi:acetylglutamate kinase
MSDVAAVLTEALPYIQQFRDAIVVVKFGGNALADGGDVADALASFAGDIVLMRAVGLKPVVVHGGGPQITELLDRLGIEARFEKGLRVTDAATLDVARMVLAGKVNREIVSAINVHGPLAVGVSGEDAGLLQATPTDPALGFVGDVAAVNPAILDKLLAEDLIPVIATIGTGEGGQAYNINADTAAGAIAAALGARKLVMLTNVEGLRRDAADPSTLISRVRVGDLEALLPTLDGGMIPKVASCVFAVRGGVPEAHILDGRVPHVVLVELFTDAGIGTMILAEGADA